MVTQVKRSAFVRALRQRVRGEVAADEMSRGLYATDASIYQLEDKWWCSRANPGRRR